MFFLIQVEVLHILWVSVGISPSYIAGSLRSLHLCALFSHELPTIPTFKKTLFNFQSPPTHFFKKFISWKREKLHFQCYASSSDSIDPAPAFTQPRSWASMYSVYSGRSLNLTLVSSQAGLSYRVPIYYWATVSLPLFPVQFLLMFHIKTPLTTEIHHNP